MSGGRWTKKIPEYVWFIDHDDDWVQGPYVNKPRYATNLRKFKLVEENE